MNPQIANARIDLISNTAKLGIHLSELPEAKKTVANWAIDTTAIALKRANEEYEKRLAEHRRKVYIEAAMRYNLNKVVTFVDGQNRPYFRMYGGDIEGFAKACGIAITKDLPPETDRAIAELEQKYGVVIYERA